MKVLGIDPGKKPTSFGYTLHEAPDEVVPYNIDDITFLEGAYFETTIQLMTTPNIIAFRIEFQCLLEYLELTSNDILVSELYFTRDKKVKGNPSAYVNMMLGVMAAVCFEMQIPFEYYYASVWKPRFSKQHGLPADEFFPNYNGLTKHLADSSGQAHYYLMRRHDLKNKEELRIQKEKRKEARLIKAEERRVQKEQRKEARLIKAEERRVQEERRKKERQQRIEEKVLKIQVHKNKKKI